MTGLRPPPAVATAPRKTAAARLRSLWRVGARAACPLAGARAVLPVGPPRRVSRGLPPGPPLPAAARLRSLSASASCLRCRGVCLRSLARKSARCARRLSRRSVRLPSPALSPASHFTLYNMQRLRRRWVARFSRSKVGGSCRRQVHREGRAKQGSRWGSRSLAERRWDARLAVASAAFPSPLAWARSISGRLDGGRLRARCTC